MAIIKEITPEQIARIKLRYEARVTPVHDIAADEGVSPSQIYELRRRFKWPTRTELGRRLIERSIEQERAISEAMRRRARTSPRTPAAPFDPAPLIAHVQEALDTELKAALARDAKQGERNAEATARTLASLTRALHTLHGLAGGEKAPPRESEPPLDLEELRRELARRLDALREEADGA